MTRITMIVWLLAGGACGDGGTASGHDAKSSSEQAKPKSSATVVVVSRIPALANSPCEQCHRHVESPETRSTKAHSDIRVTHMPDAQCQSCHDPTEPTRLKLASGQAIDLDDAHLLCGQCHSTETADWSVGIHGKQLGNWQTEIHRYSCTHCHDAHAPKFGTMQAVDPPPFPKMGIPKGTH